MVDTATLAVSWGYDVSVELVVSKENWSKILRGNQVRIRGRGYYYEGDFFWDYWNFRGGLDGELIVNYGSPKDGDYSGVGFEGKLRDAIADEN